MEIKCVNCGHRLNLDHAVFDNYAGTVKCFSCSSIMEVKIEERILHGARLLTLEKRSPSIRQKYASSII